MRRKADIRSLSFELRLRGVHGKLSTLKSSTAFAVLPTAMYLRIDSTETLYPPARKIEADAERP
jgi:hypothetical protein